LIAFPVKNLLEGLPLQLATPEDHDAGNKDDGDLHGHNTWSEPEQRSAINAQSSIQASSYHRGGTKYLLTRARPEEKYGEYSANSHIGEPSSL
jgi:hypothetical protein